MPSTLMASTMLLAGAMPSWMSFTLLPFSITKWDLHLQQPGHQCEQALHSGKGQSIQVSGETLLPYQPSDA